MIISVNWLKKFTPINGTIDELAALIGSRLVEIESVENIAEKYSGVVVARIVSAVPLEGSDHLNVVMIDDGGVVTNVERNDAGYVQVVCGAPNVREGLFVAWLPPSSIVPETFNEAEPFVLAAKPLRGVVSNGMLASARELDLYDDHSGILEIDKETTPGASFAELYELDDYLLDIENKSLTHRPDAFGVIGFAREVAGIQGLPFNTPQWLQDLSVSFQVEQPVVMPRVVIEDETLSDRFQVVALQDINEAAVSPIQLQTYLARSGVRPINASVDVSNYLMLLTGQPSHAYDYDKLRAIAGDDFSIRVRLAREGETLVLLDGKTVKLDSADIVIAAGDTAIGLAGIMGGQSTMVDAATKTVLLEVATFDLYHMRSSQMRHGIFSEAVTRFTKGIPAPLSSPVTAEAVRMLEANAGAHIASDIVEDYPGTRDSITIHVTEAQVNGTLGTQFAAEDIAQLLENVGFSVSFNGLEGSVIVPYWRQDIHITEDIIEEVGRLAGFDSINVTLPTRDFTAVRPSDFDALRSVVRKRLARAGANEVLTYSFVHGDTLTRAGQDPANAYRITNSISPELQYYRQSLTPSLVSQVFSNVKAGYGSFALFELNKIHQKSDNLTDEQVPVERDSLALVITDAKRSGDAYYSAKNILEYLVSVLGLSLVYKPLVEASALSAPFEALRSAQVYDKATDTLLGVVGEYKKSVQKSFKLPAFTAGFEIDTHQLLVALAAVGVTYQPLSRYPGTERDICFQVAQSIAYADIVTAAEAELTNTALITTVSPLDIYELHDGNTKNITIRIALASYEKTLTNEAVNEIMDRVIKAVTDATHGKVV